MPTTHTHHPASFDADTNAHPATTDGLRVLIVLGHPDGESLCAALAGRYAQAAREAGHAVQVLRLGELAFDPILHQGYRSVQALEPDLVHAQASLRWAEHTVWVYPIWWGSVPALLKGFLDRVFLPGFAFKFRPGKSLPDPLLDGRTAHLLVTMDTPPWYFRWVYRAPGLHQMARTTLAFCGIRPTATLALGPVLGATPTRRAAWLDQAQALAVGLKRRR